MKPPSHQAQHPGPFWSGPLLRVAAATTLFIASVAVPAAGGARAEGGADPLLCAALSSELEKVEKDYRKQLAFSAIWADESAKLNELGAQLESDAAWAGADAWAIVEGVEQLADLTFAMSSLVCESTASGRVLRVCTVGTTAYDALKLAITIARDPSKAVDEVVSEVGKKLVSVLGERLGMKEVFERGLALQDAVDAMKTMVDNEGKRRELRELTRAHVARVRARLESLANKTAESAEVQAALWEVHRGLQRMIRESKCTPSSSTASTCPVPWPANLRADGKFDSQRKGRTNMGVDFVGELGQEVVAVLDGKVALAEANWDPNGFGTTVILEHRDGVYSLYAQLGSVGVTKGQEVTAGQALGTFGFSGNSTPDKGKPYLHFRLARDPERRAGLADEKGPVGRLAAAKAFVDPEKDGALATCWTASGR